MHTKLLFLLFAILVASIVSISGCGGDSETVVLPPSASFTDPNLEEAVRDAIGQPTGDILVTDLVGLLILDASGLAIADLGGLESCVDLQDLDLHDNNLTNTSHLDQLSGLVDLTELNLDDNNFSDLSWIDGLVNLETLNLNGNNIISLGHLEGLTDLVTLRLENNLIVTINALEFLVNLETLILAHNQITDVTPLVNNSGLDTATDTINIDGNPLPCTAFADLAAEPRLADLDPVRTFADAILTTEIETMLGLAPGDDIHQSQLCTITTANLPLVGITDLDGMEYCYELELLDLSGNDVTDLTPLANLTHMLGLNLQDNIGLDDLSPLANLTLMVELDLSSIDALVDISGIENMENLVVIDLDTATMVVDSTPLCDCYANGGLHDAASTVVITGSGLAPLFPGDACLDQLDTDGVTIIP
jgi:internalin A